VSRSCAEGQVGVALFLAAKVLLSRRTRGCALKTWGMEVAARRGYMKAVIAVARRRRSPAPPSDAKPSPPEDELGLRRTAALCDGSR
jgi:hypothetical protein